jgi:glycosyltransferase involved in cell wall biosynthesis
VLQRLEHEKDTFTALRAWRKSRMFEEGWTLRIVGDGAERSDLEAWVAASGVPGVVFTGWQSDVTSEFARAGILLAPAPSDSFGFAVLEAISAGVPVVASAAGGHLETVGRLPEAALFPPGDVGAARAALRALLSDAVRAAASAAGRKLVQAEFTIERHVGRLLPEYEAAMRGRRNRFRPKSKTTMEAPRARGSSKSQNGRLRELVVCSLEAWDEVWRRNQFLVDALLRRNPELRVLFVEPPADPLFDLWQRRLPQLPRLRSLTADGRLRAFRPLKVLPRRAGPLTDRVLRHQIETVTRFVGFSKPTLWLNDVTYAPLLTRTGWPSVYDVTDDWLHAPFAPSELERLGYLEELAIEHADEVVVCSQALAKSRGASRAVSVIPNGLDVEHFRRPQPRPRDLPAPPVAVYVGSLHDARLDIELVVDVARALPDLSLAFVGPNSLSANSQASLEGLPNVDLLGPRPYENVPAYLQHADIIIVPHRVSPFTESLDPIKLYECLVVDTRTVATPIAGFREHEDKLVIAERDAFAECVVEVLSGPSRSSRTVPTTSWDERGSEFELVLQRASRRRTPGGALCAALGSGATRREAS